MVDASEPPAGDATDRPEATERSLPEDTRSPARKLDRRTVAICVCIALVAALVAGLIASLAMGDSGGPANGKMTLSAPGSIDSSRLLAQRLDTPAGKPTNLGAHLAEQPMLVNVWASSCQSCVDEMPLLQTASKHNPKVTFVGVATQDRPSAAKALAKQTGITYPWALDPTGELFYDSKGAGMPTTLLLSADGDVLATKTGSFQSATQLQSFIDEHTS